MNIEKNLIFLNGKDKTEQIKYCKYDSGKYKITFNNTDKVYTYGYNSVQWFNNVIEYDAEENIIYEENSPISGVIKIMEFDGQYIRVIFKNGYNKLYCKSQIRIEKSCLKSKISSNCFDYLKKLSNYVSITTDDGISLLSKQYNKLNKVSKESVLAKYLEHSKLKFYDEEVNLLFPFGFNISQKEATKNAFTSQISVIEGPPGTGKTQTILNIIANAIFQGKTVAIVSNNNSATENVYEKLKKYNVDFIAAFLGNNNNKEKFFENQDLSYPDMNEWILDKDKIEELKSNLVNSQKKLDEMLKIQNQVAILKEELSAISIEDEHFKKYYKDEEKLSYKYLFNQTSNSIMKMLVEYKYTLKEKGYFSLKNKIKNFILYGIYTFKFYYNSIDDIVDFLQNKYYDLKIEELNKEIGRLEKQLDNFNFDKYMKKYSNTSMKLLKAVLAERHNGKEVRPQFSKEDLWKNSFINFISEYPVILSTTHSLRNCASENYLFDYVIIDEASQVDIVTGVLALSCGKNAVIVGDLKQLPNVVSSDIENKTKKIFDSYNLNAAYSYFDNSLLSSIVKLYSEIPKTLLKEHYRCHPQIIGYCNKKFYNDELIILTDSKSEDKPLVVYKTVKGNHARKRINQRQIDVIFKEVIPNQNIDIYKESIGIISPYRPQADELKKIIGNSNIEADTVHKYQGREKDVIIITTVANETNKFIDNPNLINVAVSRAVNKLILVVPDNDFDNENSNIGDLIKYIQYNNLEIVNSNINSVFDLLYKCYFEKLKEFLKKSKKVSEFNSENLMNALLEKVLREEEFKCLDYALHYPLRSLIQDTSKLIEDDEYKFAMNNLTHIDFLLFNKMNKMPVLAIEVDGYAYHAENNKQLKRDKMKDHILKTYGIEILRFSTNGSDEENKLRGKLRSLLNANNIRYEEESM
ncbi:DUF2726 domain-containing protein [Clostridium botulinum]|nr:DUF2726 domain-containing protein [Clostridium botulinum]NFI17344.1 DUF2726 domain-containing protein [Clostridium botulinum]NFL94065.1 DUF2726 domain-containing protein [Clostridium botulinum]NFN50747.1 DUF2726 domain-containing protein [Clostridium botulinum]NFO27030.1 DUF2726 domain-containing protein [Clostridium botulinum]